MNTTSWLTPVMFLTMAGMIMLGFPVGMTLIVHGVIFTIVGALLDQFPWALSQAHMLRVYGLLSNDVLLAIPFFTLMGMVLERSGIAEDMLRGLSKLLQCVRGGLALAVVVIGTVLAATTGVIQASIIAMGYIALPAMLSAGYSSRLSTGIIAASGTLAQLIPPSLVLIVMADATGVPIFRMYERALLPGLLLALSYAMYVVVLVQVKPMSAPPTAAIPTLADIAAALWSLLPPAAIVAVTVGSVLSGFATSTESGGFGATASLALAAARGRLKASSLRAIVDSTTVVSCCALFIMIGATFFTLPFNAMDGKQWMGSLFAHLPGGETGFLIAAVLLAFVLAFLLDFFEIAFLALPMLMPTVITLGIDPAWFAVLVCIALQTSFMHPPFGVAIYTLRSVAPQGVSSTDIYCGVVPFIILQLVVALLVIAAPGLAFDFGKPPVISLPDTEVERILRELP